MNAMICETERATGAAAVSMTVAPGRDWVLEEVRVHLSAAGGAANLTITIDAGAGAAYDYTLATQDMTSVTNYTYQPTRPINLSSGDKILIAWANGSTRTYGIEVKYR